MIAPERYQCLGEFLRDGLIQFKSETAIIEVNRKRDKASYSYLDVKRLGERLAARFQELGVRPGDRVAIIMSNQPAWLISAYAVFYCGGVLVPLDYKMDPAEKETLLKHCGARLLITEYGQWRDLQVELPTLVSEMPKTASLPKMAARWEDLPPNRGTFEMRGRGDPATIVYSSGTGGNPKGCVLSHHNYLEQYRSLISIYPFEIGDRYFSILPTNHAIDFMCGFIGPFACGATVVHQRSLRPEFLQWTMQKRGITHMAVVPLILEAFERRINEALEERSNLQQSLVSGLRQLNAQLTLKKPRRQLSRALLRPVHQQLGPDLKLLFSGGAFVDPARAQLFYDLGIPVVVGYGLTEAGTVLTVNDMKPFRADSVGKPLPGVQIDIRNADASGVGEVWVKSPTVFSGYLDDPEQTAQVLREGWLSTGDNGRLDPSGRLHLVGRSKNMIVTAGGKNVYPEDIESAFEGLDCEEFAVFASGYVWPDIELKEEELVAVVRPKSDLHAGLIAELSRRNQRLPEHKRVRGLLAWEQEFPRTASMKIKRSALADEIRSRGARSSIQSVQEPTRQ